MNALLDETRTKNVEFGLPMLDQLRMSPTVVALLKAEKGTSETWGDFATRGMVALAVMRRIVRDQHVDANALLVGLLHGSPDKPQMTPTNVGLPDNGRKPLAKVGPLVTTERRAHPAEGQRRNES